MDIVLIVAVVIAIIIIVVMSVSKGRNDDFFRSDFTSFRDTNTADYKGEYGEKCVSYILGGNIDGVQYVVNNLLYVDSEGKSRQIDHVYINKSGIWVIETKNYAGYIFGEDNQRQWMQVIAGFKRGYYGVGRKYKEKNQFYNPVKQNMTHIYSLSKQLGVKNVFHNVVVFLSRADISNVKSDSVYTEETLQTIKTKTTNVFLSPEQMKIFYDKLIALKSENTLTVCQHVSNIHKMQDDLKSGKCPRCGGNLVLRNGKNGTFYGCSNYQKCKFTKNREDSSLSA